jgi:hypothetical protein
MRPIILGQPTALRDDKAFRTWVMECMNEIERASYDDVAVVANDFTVTNHTKTRTLDASTAVLADVINVLCTFIEDIQNRGAKRNQ